MTSNLTEIGDASARESMELRYSGQTEGRESIVSRTRGELSDQLRKADRVLRQGTYAGTKGGRGRTGDGGSGQEGESRGSAERRTEQVREAPGRAGAPSRGCGRVCGW